MAEAPQSSARRSSRPGTSCWSRRPRCCAGCPAGWAAGAGSTSRWWCATPSTPEPMVWEAAPAGRRRSRGAPAPARQAPAAAPRPDRRAPAQPRRSSPAQSARLAAWRAGLAARQSERSLLDLMAAGEDGWLGGEQASLDAPLPAELVAQAYQRLGPARRPRAQGPPGRGRVRAARLRRARRACASSAASRSARRSWSAASRARAAGRSSPPSGA